MQKLLTLLITAFWTTVFGQVEQKQKPSDFLPKGYKIFEQINGDLNKDGINDCILIIKGTDTSRIVTNESNEKLDRNRRGIVVLLDKTKHYELIEKNYGCFSSENEDGGVYFPPELSVEIKKGNLLVEYGHGRYGFSQYTFRYQNSDFELIGYDESSNSGPVIDRQTSINFLTRKKLEQVNINENAEGGDEIFKKKWTDIKMANLIKLSQIKDFDKLDMTSY